MTRGFHLRQTGASGLKALPADRVWDAVVVGAGPAGSLSALELARRGKSILLVDRVRFPRWKVCGSTLSPGARDILARAGLGRLLEEARAVPLEAILLGGGPREVRLPLNGSMALSRNTFDLALIRAAGEAGAYVLQGARASLKVLEKDRRILEVSAEGLQREVSARVVVAADGLSSGLMAQAGIPSLPSGSSRRPLVGLGRIFPPETPFYEPGTIYMAVGEEGYVGLCRLEDGSLDVAAALRAESMKEAGSPHALVSALLGRAGWPTPPEAHRKGWKGTPELTRRPRRPGAERLLAVGDASGYVEPFTGEGMFWALAGARALAPLAGEADSHWRPEILERWTGIHGRLIGRAQRYCRALAWTLARPHLTRTSLRLLGRFPSLSGPLVRRVGAPLAGPA